VRSSAVMPDGWLCLEVKRTEVGDFGGGSLEHPRRWLEAH
jgi:hypothetical protein